MRAGTSESDSSLAQIASDFRGWRYFRSSTTRAERIPLAGFWVSIFVLPSRFETSAMNLPSAHQRRLGSSQSPYEIGKGSAPFAGMAHKFCPSGPRWELDTMLEPSGEK